MAVVLRIYSRHYNGSEIAVLWRQHNLISKKRKRKKKTKSRHSMYYVKHCEKQHAGTRSRCMPHWIFIDTFYAVLVVYPIICHSCTHLGEHQEHQTHGGVDLKSLKMRGFYAWQFTTPLLHQGKTRKCTIDAVCKSSSLVSTVLGASVPRPLCRISEMQEGSCRKLLRTCWGHPGYNKLAGSTKWFDVRRNSTYIQSNAVIKD